MCARFQSPKVTRLLTRRYGLNCVLNNDHERAEKRPTDEALAITAPQRGEFLHWGFHYDWSSKPLINIRTETILEKATFRPILNNRCLILASSWYEWRKDGPRKLKNKIAIKGEEVLSFAALKRGNHFSILTCPPHPDIAHIHARMPVIINTNQISRWLDKDIQTHELHAELRSPKGVQFIVEEETPHLQQMSLF